MRVRVLRGGFWASDPRDLRSAARDRNSQDYRDDDDDGFRVARTLWAGTLTLPLVRAPPSPASGRG